MSSNSEIKAFFALKLRKELDCEPANRLVQANFFSDSLIGKSLMLA